MLTCDRNFLFGVIALREKFITEVQFLEAFETWTDSGWGTFGEHLVAKGTLDERAKATIESLQNQTLKCGVGASNDVIESMSNTASQTATSDGSDSEKTQEHAFAHGATEADDDRHPRDQNPRFRLLRLHANGALGAVFVARDLEVNREVALKEILEQHADNPSSRARFLLEAEITGALEHPGIVPVYALGKYLSGRPYYAMRFIRGKSLKEAITQLHANKSSQKNRGQSSLEIRRLLRRFIDVCNTMEYAHSRSVIHRDLKPSNIIVGNYGETLIVDWGLAKILGESEHQASDGSIHPVQSSGSVETIQGSAVGTPAFMSPEQARADVDDIDKRSDIYCLGSTLYNLLTGSVPVFDLDVHAVFDRVRRGDFPKPREVDSKIDPAIEAICLKAMANRPDDRYQSCHALAEDIERWMSDSRVYAYREPVSRRLGRWSRRNQLAVSVSVVTLIVGLAGLMAVLAVRSKASQDLSMKNLALEGQRNKAEDRENQAVGAVKRFRDAVASDPALINRPELIAARKRLLRFPLEYYRDLATRLAADDDTKPEALKRLAGANLELALINEQVGDKADSLTAYREAIKSQRKLVQASPSDLYYLVQLAMMYAQLGNGLRDSMLRAEARQEYKAASLILQDLVLQAPSNPHYKSDLAGVYNSMGFLSHLEDHQTDARESYDKAISMFEALVKESPQELNFRIALAHTYNNLGFLSSASSRPEQAVPSYEAALRINQALARENPGRDDCQAFLGGSYFLLGTLQQVLGLRDESQESLQNAIKIHKSLGEKNPTVTSHRSAEALAHTNLGNLLFTNGQRDEAIRELAESSRMTRELVINNETIASFKTALIESLQLQGAVLRESGMVAEANSVLKDAFQRSDEFLKKDPYPAWNRCTHTKSLTQMGINFQRAGDNVSAQKYFEDALTLVDSLPPEQLATPDMSMVKGMIFKGLARVMIDEKQYDAARQHLKDGKIWSKKSLDIFPRNPVYRREYASLLSLQIILSRGTSNPSDASAAEQELHEFRLNDPRAEICDARLRAMATSEKIKENSARLEVALLANDCGRYVSAARFWGDAMKANPRLTQDRGNKFLYQAACAASWAATEHGSDSKGLTHQQKTKLRDDVMQFLQQELVVWKKEFANPRGVSKVVIQQNLEGWKVEPAFKAFRDRSSLPTIEQAPWNQLWSDVDELLAKTKK
jgi:serine/threonine-protein kinase